MRSWKEVRPEVVTDEAQVAARREQLEAEAAAWRRARIAKAAERVARASAGLNRRLADE